jgi:hypothetical protein
MKSPALLVIIATLFASIPCFAQEPGAAAADRIKALLGRDYDYKLISSGQNFPPFNVRREHRGDLIVLLSEGIPVPAIQAHFGWSESEMQARLDALEAAELIRGRTGHGYRAAVMVMSLSRVARYVTVSDSVMNETAALVVRHLPEVRRRYAAIEGFGHVPFERASFLILSNVLLDNWQIRAVERDFLGAERPLRSGSRYYYSIQENAGQDSTEAFGIYGNQYRGYGPYTVGIYGNRRTRNDRSFINLGKDEIEDLFTARPDSVREFKQEVLRSVVLAARDPDSAIDPQIAPGLKRLGWVSDNQVVIPVLDDEDEAALSDLAALITDDLVALLERHRPQITLAYSTSPYSSDITFEEYFMWWYHLFYTAVTDRLILQGHIEKPGAGITSYVIAPR